MLAAAVSSTLDYLSPNGQGLTLCAIAGTSESTQGYSQRQSKGSLDSFAFDIILELRLGCMAHTARTQPGESRNSLEVAHRPSLYTTSE